MQATKTPIPPDKLVYRLRLMAESGGNLTRDRVRVIIEAANLIDDLIERIAIMTEHEFTPANVNFSEQEGAKRNG